MRVLLRAESATIRAVVESSSRRTIFLLSPAHCGGERAQLLLREGASFALAQRIRAPAGAPLGDVFSFLSGLYFRGKMAYAREFQRPPPGVSGIFVITPNAGLLEPDERMSLVRLRKFATTDIAEADPRYERPLLRDAKKLDASAEGCELVLLGSIATGKYVTVLSRVFGSRLLFPRDFVGRGDMSRGGLMLRCARENRELEYVPVLGAERHGKRPPKLPKLPVGSTDGGR
jgi:hypothetical protein